MRKLIYAILLTCTITGCDVAQQVLNQANGNGGLTTNDIVAGLKEALTIGTQNSSNQLSLADGFFANAAIKILMPPEAQKVDKTLRRRIIYILKNENKNPDSIKFVISSVEQAGGIRYAIEKMNAYRDEALAILHEYDESPVRNALEELVRYTTDRKY